MGVSKMKVRMVDNYACIGDISGGVSIVDKKYYDNLVFNLESVIAENKTLLSDKDALQDKIKDLEKELEASKSLVDALKQNNIILEKNNSILETNNFTLKQSNLCFREEIDNIKLGYKAKFNCYFIALQKMLTKYLRGIKELTDSNFNRGMCTGIQMVSQNNLGMGYSKEEAESWYNNNNLLADEYENFASYLLSRLEPTLDNLKNDVSLSQHLDDTTISVLEDYVSQSYTALCSQEEKLSK